MRISAWSSDVCSSDLHPVDELRHQDPRRRDVLEHPGHVDVVTLQQLPHPSGVRGLVSEIELLLDHLLELPQGVAQVQVLPQAEELDDSDDPFEVAEVANEGDLGSWTPDLDGDEDVRLPQQRSEEHTSELQSPMRISYAVLCLTKKKL